MEQKKQPEAIAKELFKKGYNCAQSVVGAFAEELEMDFNTLMVTSSSFGGGMGRLREVCGSVSGMFMVIGIKYGYSDPKDYILKADHYERIQTLAKIFKDENGSYICRELLGLGHEKDNHLPERRTQEYYKKRPCDELVGYAAKITSEFIKNN